MESNSKSEIEAGHENEQLRLIDGDAVEKAPGVDVHEEEGSEVVKGKPRLKKPNRDQMMMAMIDVEELVPPDHPVRAIWQLVGSLDLSEFVEEIKAVEGRAGRTAWDPQLLISLWIYAYSDGVNSAREIERLSGHWTAP